MGSVYEVLIFRKLGFSVKLDTDELRYLVYECEVETIHGENRRWTRTNKTIAEIGGKFFSIEWEEGLTENQPDEFYYQPVEVEKYEETKVITVVTWKPIKKND